MRKCEPISCCRKVQELIQATFILFNSVLNPTTTVITLGVHYALQVCIMWLKYSLDCDCWQGDAGFALGSGWNWTEMAQQDISCILAGSRQPTGTTRPCQDVTQVSRHHRCSAHQNVLLQAHWRSRKNGRAHIFLWLFQGIITQPVSCIHWFSQFFCI